MKRFLLLSLALSICFSAYSQSIGGKQKSYVEITDGVHEVDVNADGTLDTTAVQGGTWDIGTVTTITDDVNINDGGNTITVDGSVNSTLQAGTAIAGKAYVTDGTDDLEVTSSGYIGVHIQDGITPSRKVGISPSRQMKVGNSIRLVGTTFDNDTKDTNFWTETVTGSGSITQDGECHLDTGATANSTAKYVSVSKARFIAGTPLEFKTSCEFYTAGAADNIRQIGAYDANNGFFFQLDGTTFSIGSRSDGVDTLVSSGNFNGDVSTYVMNTSAHKMIIEISSKTACFIIDGVLIHKLGLTHINRPKTLTLPVTIENNNDNGSTSDIEFHVAASTIHRIGQLETNGTFKFIGTNTTTVCKYGAGVLHTIVNCDNSGTVTVYDNTAASGPQIAVIDTGKALGTLSFYAPFSTGLTIVTASGAKITVVYE